MDDPFESTPVAGASSMRKPGDKPKAHNAPLTPLSTNIPNPHGDGVQSPDSNSATIGARLQVALEEQNNQLEMVAKWGQQLLAQKTELEERIHGLGDVDLDVDEIDDATASKVLDLQEAMKSWEAENQTYAHSLQKSNVRTS